MAFTLHGSLVPYGGPILYKVILANSVAMVVMDSVKIDSGNGNGFLALGTAGKSVFGHVRGITSRLDVGVSTDGTAGAELGSFLGAFTAASDNETVAAVRGECDISQMTLYSAEMSATLGTTTGSDQIGYKADLTDEDTLDESSTLATTLQYNLWGADVVDSTRVICNIFESGVFNDAQV